MAVRENDFGQPVGDPVPEWSGAPYPPGAVLSGRLVVLRPLEAGDADDLWAAWSGTSAADWTYLPMERPADLAGTRSVVDAMVADPTTVAYVVLVAGGLPERGRHQGPQPRHRLVVGDRRRVAGGARAARRVARAVELRRRRAPAQAVGSRNGGVRTRVAVTAPTGSGP